MKLSARKRGHSFKLKVDDLRPHWQQPCTYCGRKTTTVNLDRVDNTRGYEVDNVVPCCPTCNRLKGSLPVESFVRQVFLIAANHPPPSEEDEG